MKKIITKKKTTVVPNKPITKTKNMKVNLLVKYNFLFGSITIFVGLLLFFLIETLFVNNLIKLYLIKENIIHPPVKVCELTPIPTQPIPPVLTTEKEINTLTDFSWQESEVITLPDGIKTLSNLDFLSSPDGSQFAYVNNSNNQVFVSLNGNAGPLYDKIMFMIFSPDSQHFAYGVKTGSKEAVVIDGELKPLYDWIFEPYFFTPDSKHFVYIARNGSNNFVVFDDKEGNNYNQIYHQYISADRKTLIYYARRDNKIYKNVLELGTARVE